jgi:aldose 1-epimerase
MISNLVDPKNFNKIVDGKNIVLFTLTNKNGLTTQITNFGGRIVSLFTPDLNGDFEDIVLGYDNIESYMKPPKEIYLGALIGRYANRITKGRFKLNGTTLKTAINNQPNHLHGGLKGFSNVVWNATLLDKQNLELSYLSLDGEEGYPGELKVTVIYRLTDENSLKIEYHATTNKPTPINLTNHSYFNLNGAASGSIENHLLKLNANYYLPIDCFSIPKGKSTSVINSPFDFRTLKRIGKDINTNDKQLKIAKGYDHNFICNTSKKEDIAAYVVDPISKRTLTVYTNEPGIQFYSGNYITGCGIGKKRTTYLNRNAFCLETQHFPNSPNQQNFPSTILNTNEAYHSFCCYKFGIKKPSNISYLF